MTKALTKKPATELTAADLQILTEVGVIPAGTPENVVRFFGKTCAEMKLSPFKKQIHLVKRSIRVEKWDAVKRAKVESFEPRYSIQTGVDGYRSRADSTGRYAGSDDYKFDEGLSEFQMVDNGRTQPMTATVTVYKIIGGIRCPFTASARWMEYCPKGDKESFFWFKAPFLMLGKVAECLALRKAFPNETSGVYVDEEMAHVPAVTETLQEPPVTIVGEPAKVEVEVVPESAPTPAGEPSQPVAENKPELPPDTAWREVQVHYGKNNGKKLGELSEASLRWYIDKFELQEAYESGGKTIQNTPENIAIQKRFREALDMAVEFNNWTE